MGWLNAAPAKELIQKGQNSLNLGAVHRHDGRSTKAGAEPPATHFTAFPTLTSSPIRSTKAGAKPPATLQHVAIEGLLEVRSTKAGAETPATRARHGLRPPCQASLNEGRG